MHEHVEEKSLVVLVGLDLLGQDLDLTELKALVEAAGGEVVGEITQQRSAPDPAHYIGTGKVEEVKTLVLATAANLVIVDAELAPSQIRNLEKRIDVRVIDRTQLILDIFAQRAQTHEGRLQVEIAQLQYALPRLTGRGTEMSRLGSGFGGAGPGIGTRGPGESKLEMDRRHIRERIAQLRSEVKEIRRHRQLLRESRVRRGYPLVALVGYTNAGKSSLLNALTAAEAYAADMLFATLDTTTRALALPDGREIALTDTVGFISRLPHHLVDAFYATLEEVQFADLLIHVVDASNPDMLEQTRAVDQVLKELKADDKHIIIAYNKADLLDQPDAWLPERNGKPYALISAVNGAGLGQLKELIAANLPNLPRRVTYLIPYAQGDASGWLHRQGEVVQQSYENDGMRIVVELQEQQISQFSKIYQLIPVIEGEV